MRLKSLLMVSLILSVGLVSAQSMDDVEPRPGLITADSVFYPVDKALDGVMSSEDEVAFERASEYAVAVERNQSRAMERANRSLGEVVSRTASSNETEGFEKAQSVLEQVRERNGEMSNEGLDNAIRGLEEKSRRACVPKEEEKMVCRP